MKSINKSSWFNKGGINTGTLYLVVILVLMGVVGAQLTNGLVPSNQPNKKGTVVTPKFEAPEPDKNNLQLYTFGFTSGLPSLAPSPPTPTNNPTITPASTPTPTSSLPTLPPLPTSGVSPTTPPTNTCPIDGFKTPGCGACIDLEAMACEELVCQGTGWKLNLPIGDPSAKSYCMYIEQLDPVLYQQKSTQPNCAGYCIAKPVIYLYPLLPTLVDVKITVPGSIIVSDPLYPDGGWKDVLANPDGSLVYENKNYQELFFESDVDKVNAPKNGMIIAKKDLKIKLTEATTKLGLRNREQTEFLEYWLPELYKLDSPYILFSVIDPVEKERIDHVDITPKPDTFIAFLAYFKPLKYPKTNLAPLKLPQNPPARFGFTAVEWGGTIDFN